MDVYWESAKSSAELRTHQCVSACVFTLSNVHSARESTLENGVKKKTKKKNKKKISTHVTEEPKITHLVVSQSHSPFFNFSFSIVVASRPVTRPPNLSLRLSVVMETSQVSVLPAVAPAVHCGICGSVLKTYCQAKH